MIVGVIMHQLYTLRQHLQLRLQLCLGFACGTPLSPRGF